MLNTKARYAQLFLGFYFIRRLIRRLFFLESPSLGEFVQYYRGDKITLLNKNDKELFKQASACISCGLCDGLNQGTSWTSFVPRLSRSIPDFVGNSGLGQVSPASYREVESLCPMGVPLQKLIRFIKDKEHEILQSPVS